MQIHYSNVSHVDAVDGSGVDLCTTDQLRANDADVMAFGSDHFCHPAALQLRSHVPRRARSHRAGPPSLRGHAAPARQRPALEHALQPRDGGEPIELVSQPRWDINNQSWFQIDTTLRAGDKVATRCKWTNPTDDPIYWGDATADEMCYAFTMYYRASSTRRGSGRSPRVSPVHADSLSVALTRKAGT